MKNKITDKLMVFSVVIIIAIVGYSLSLMMFGALDETANENDISDGRYAGEHENNMTLNKIILYVMYIVIMLISVYAVIEILKKFGK